MRLDPKALGLAAGAMAVALFVICAVGVALAPEFTSATAGVLLHADLSAFIRTLNWGNFFGGLLGWGVGTAVVFSLLAGLYNRLGSARG